MTFASKCGTALICMTTLFASQAHADRNNHRIYPGTMCQLRGDDLRAGRWSILAVSQFGHIGNTAEATPGAPDLNLVCPIERRARRSAAGINVMVRFQDPEAVPDPGKSEFCCVLHNARPGIVPLGAEFSVEAASRDCESVNTAGFGSSLLQLEQSNRDSRGNTTNSESAGAYSLSCVVPPGAILIDYTVREND